MNGINLTNSSVINENINEKTDMIVIVPESTRVPQKKTKNPINTLISSA